MIKAPDKVGLVVVGDEVLLGKRHDRHFGHVTESMAKRGMQLAWCRYVGDDRQRLAEELRQTQLDDIPVFCFGGIGATPDDQTRQAAADAFGAKLVLHPEAASLIEEQFGEQAYPNRIRMAHLPEGCLLIPNPFNRIPGFTLYEHHFFPGFPQMAWDMLHWVLDTYYPSGREPDVERSVRVFSVKESELLGMMERLSARHPETRLFSLPHLGGVNSIELGFRGQAAEVEKAFAGLIEELNHRGLVFDVDAAAGLSVAGS